MDYTLFSFSGRLTDDPELKSTSNGSSVCKFTVAVNKRVGKDEERTSFIPTTVFGKQAENCAKYLTKGREVRVVGEFETDKYTDKDGILRKGFGCIVSESGRVDFGSGGRRDEETENGEEAAPARRQTTDDRFGKDAMSKAQESAQGGRRFTGNKTRR